MGALYGEFKEKIRFGIVCPWFADTAIVPVPVKLVMAGLPLTPVDRIGGAIFKAATDSNPESNGGVYTLPDEGDVFRIDRPDLRLDKGVYKMLNDRVDFLRSLDKRGRRTVAIIKDVTKILGPKIFWFGLTAAIGVLAWYRAGDQLLPLLDHLGINIAGSH